MIMKFDISNLDNNIQLLLKEFSTFSFDKAGCKVYVSQGVENFIEFNDNVLTIKYTNKARLVYSLFLFDTVGFVGNTDCKFKTCTAMVDMSRNAVRTVITVKKLMRFMVLMGYTDLQLYMEDVYEIPEEPYFGYKRGRYSQNELKEIVSYGNMLGLEVVPAIQTLAHLNGMVRWETYWDIVDFGDILLVDETKTYELIDHMLKSLSECFTTSKINLGLDEAHMIGLGKYLDKHGYTKRVDILARHINKVCEIARKYGFEKPMVWSDMFFRLVSNGAYASVKQLPEEILNLPPENLTMLGWNYYSTDCKYYENVLGIYKKFNREICYASGSNSWHGVTPMNKFAMNQTKAVINACKKRKVDNYMFTIWGDDGAECSIFASLPAMAYAASLANGNKNYKKLFFKMIGITFDKFVRLDLNNEVAEKRDIVVSPSKYMLYNDCLQGLMDCTVKDGDAENYRRNSLLFVHLSKDKEWGYLFETQRRLANLLSIKYDLGVRTRNAYKSNDKEALRLLVDKDYKLLIKLLDEYYWAFRDQWFLENKSYGFEIQDLRLGGLKQRIVHTRKILNDYVCGKIDAVEELEDEVLSVVCSENENGKSLDYRGHRRVVSANVYSHN